MDRLKGTKWAKSVKIIILALIMGYILVSSVIVTSAEKNIKFQDKQKTLAIGRSYKPKIINKPSNVKYTWKSSNPKVATVSSKGTIKAIKRGKVKISCVMKSGRKTSTIKMTVQVKQPSLKKKSGAIVYGEKITIPINSKPKGATYTWKTTNKKIVKVNSKGVVTAQNAGEAIIKVTIKWKKGKKTLSYKVNVKKPKISANTLNLQVNDSSKLTIKNRPKKASYTWTSSHSSIASVSSSGKVTAKKKGKATIRCDVQVGNKKITLFCNIIVKAPVIEIPEIPEKPIITPKPEKPREPAQEEKRYTYDALGRVIKVEYSNGTSIKYTYDKNGNITKVEKE